MPNTQNTKNYFAHGGNELVIGGKLTFLSGATVEGGDGLFDLPADYSAPAIADSDAATVAALKADFNALLAVLRTAGLITAPAASGGDAAASGGASDSGGSGGSAQSGGATNAGEGT